VAENFHPTAAGEDGRIPARKPLTDGVVLLREIVPDDVETLYRLRMNPISRPMFRDSGAVPWESHQGMIQRYFDSPSKDCWFMIEAGGKAVGTIVLYNFSEDDGWACEVGRFAIEPEWRRLGFGKRALTLLFEYARATGIRKLHCQVFAGNAASLSLCREFGFLPTAFHEHDDREFIDLAADLTANPNMDLSVRANPDCNA
jgi:RimJ/RimL family protein N-acetyltransferase